ncbi:MAG: helix-turn-helix domain-containing protein [Granulosicoccaceae bacterium]
MSPDELIQLEGLVATKRHICQGDALFRAGISFQSLYAVRAGCFKTSMYGEESRSQVIGFQIPGDLLGLDGLTDAKHHVDAIALVDSEVCAIPYARITQISKECPSLQLQLNRIMSCEIIKDHGVMMLLGSMQAKERLATFLLNFSERFKCLGHSPTEFKLHMSREDIGSYLGLKIETISRTLTNLQTDELISVKGKHINILNLVGLKGLIDR